MVPGPPIDRNTFQGVQNKPEIAPGECDARLGSSDDVGDGDQGRKSDPTTGGFNLWMQGAVLKYEYSGLNNQWVLNAVESVQTRVAVSL